MDIPAAPVPPEPPALPTPRLRFVRWLVDTGRLSEWPDAHYRNGVIRARLTALDSEKSSAGPAEVQR